MDPVPLEGGVAKQTNGRRWHLLKSTTEKGTAVAAGVGTGGAAASAALPTLLPPPLARPEAPCRSPPAARAPSAACPSFKEGGARRAAES